MLQGTSHWRWLDTGDSDGQSNMAIDEALLAAYKQGDVAPSVRIYGWRPHCVSLGYFQKACDVNFQQCDIRGIQVVRRLTGGRAILHADELTYSVVVDESTLGVRGVIETFRRISTGIIEGLRILGITAELKARQDRNGQSQVDSPVCFASAARCDLVVQGKKIVGSAQLRRSGTILQHGSIPLTFDPALCRELLTDGGGWEDRVTDVRCALENSSVTRAELSEALYKGFQSALGVIFKNDSLSPYENSLAMDLAASKYSRSDWTCRR